MYESNLTFEELEKYDISKSLNAYIYGKKECHECDKIKPLFLYALPEYNKIYVRCKDCSSCLTKSIVIKLSKKDEIVYLSLIKNIIR